MEVPDESNCMKQENVVPEYSKVDENTENPEPDISTELEVPAVVPEYSKVDENTETWSQISVQN